jgi:hypothetical protein
LNTKRAKRWDGTLDTLTKDYLKDVMEKMEAYGDRVQFELPGKGPRPNYQVINPAGRTMAFDKKNLLLPRDTEVDFVNNGSNVFSLDAIKAAVAGTVKKTVTRSRVAGSGTTTSRRASVSGAAIPEPVVDMVERDKYAYFKANRETLPEDIAKHSQSISELMRSGMSAEQAFDEIIKQHF